MDSAWSEVSKMGKTKKIGVNLPQLYPNLYFSNNTNSKIYLINFLSFYKNVVHKGPFV